MDVRLLHQAASAYYEHGLRQAEVAAQIGVSRPFVSKLLAEARRIGLVRIEVLDPFAADTRSQETELQELLGIDRVRIAPGDQTFRGYADLGPLLGSELASLGLRRGDVVMLATGRTLSDLSSSPALPQLPGVRIVPIVGGQAEPDRAYQSNEIVRDLAGTVGGVPQFVFAPAVPSAALYASLQDDPFYRDMTELWSRARASLVSVGGPVSARESIPSMLPVTGHELDEAIGDVGMHFFDRDGKLLEFPGSDRVVHTPFDQLCRTPLSVAVAVGAWKAQAITVAARMGLFRSLLTDTVTAEALLR